MLPTELDAHDLPRNALVSIGLGNGGLKLCFFFGGQLRVVVVGIVDDDSHGRAFGQIHVLGHEDATLDLGGEHACHGFTLSSRISGSTYSRCQRTRRDGAGPGHWHGAKPSGGAGSVSTSSRVSPAQRVTWMGTCASQMSARRMYRRCTVPASV